MNDDELITAVKGQRDKIPMIIPVEQIISRGRVVRARRRVPGLAAALAVLAAAAFAVITLLPGHQASHRPGLQLAAWTVLRQADGTVRVTIRELRDPAGLQRTLRADGVPASVIFGDQPDVAANPCQSYGDPRALPRAVTVPPLARSAGRHVAVMAIHPAALPSGAGVQIITSQARVGVHLVVASRQCTGG